MSYSSLWTMDKEFYGEELKKYHNSWLFSNIVWNQLFWKYLPEEKINKYGYKEHFLSAFGNMKKRFDKMSEKITNSTITSDKIMWALTIQLAFLNKNKELVSNSIIDFEKTYIKENNDYEEHITERFLEIAKDVKNIKTEYFIFKNSSCDDAIENLFDYFSEKEQEYCNCSLKKWKEFKIQFAVIKELPSFNIGFVSNLDFIKESNAVLKD